MKFHSGWQADGRRHEYCTGCHVEAVERITEDNETYFDCRACHQRDKRRVVLDPGMKWWVGEDREYWHESSGVFVRNPDGRFLFFRRMIYPVGALTVPSGHVDTGEEPDDAAARELAEETGIHAPGIERVACDDIVGDSCRRGSDAHRWHAFLLVLASPLDLADVTVSGEGEEPVLLTLAQARTGQLTYPVRYVIDHHAARLEVPLIRG